MRDGTGVTLGTAIPASFPAWSSAGLPAIGPQEGQDVPPAPSPKPVTKPSMQDDPFKIINCLTAAEEFADKCQHLEWVREAMVSLAELITVGPHVPGGLETVVRFEEYFEDLEADLLLRLNALAAFLVEECGCEIDQSRCTVNCGDGKWIIKPSETLEPYPWPELPEEIPEQLPEGGGFTQFAPQEIPPESYPTVPAPGDPWPPVSTQQPFELGRFGAGPLVTYTLPPGHWIRMPWSALTPAERARIQHFRWRHTGSRREFGDGGGGGA